MPITTTKKAKNPKKAKKSKKSSTKKRKITYENDSSTTEEGEISDSSSSASSSEDLDADQILDKALVAEKKLEGCWNKIYPSMTPYDLMILSSSVEIFSSASTVISNALTLGGTALQTFTKNLKLLEKKWSVLDSHYDTRKHIPEQEKKSIKKMIKASSKVIEIFLKEFNSTNFTKSAVQTLTNKYDEDVLRALLGGTVCKDIVVKIRGLIRANKQLTNVSWGKMCEWKAFQDRNSDRGNNHNGNYRSRGRGRGRGRGGYNRGHGYSGYGYGYGNDYGYGSSYGSGYGNAM